MKKKEKLINDNFFSNKNRNKIYNSLEINTINKIQPINGNGNISNHFMKKFHKKGKTETKNALYGSSTSNIDSKSLSSFNIPYHNILDDLLKYLENKLNPKLYEELNEYLNQKINNYYSSTIDNADRSQSKKRNADTNKNTLNSKANTFSNKKYKSYLNFSILDKNTKNIFNNNLTKRKNLMKKVNSIKSSHNKKNSLKRNNLLSKLMISNDYMIKKIKLLENRKKKKNTEKKNLFNNKFFYTTNNINQLNQDSLKSFEKYYKGSSENFKNIVCEKKTQKNENGNKIENTEKEIERIKIYKKINPIKNNSKLNRKNFNIISGKCKQKSLNDIDKYINTTINNQNHISKSIGKVNKLDNKKIYNNLKINISSHNNTNSFNFYQNNNNNTNNEFKNNMDLRNQNITINVNLDQRPSLNKKYLMNEKLVNKLNKNKNHFFNDINKIKNIPYNLNRYSIFSKFNSNSKNLINKANKLSYISSIKNTKNNRFNDINNKKTITSLRKKSIGLINGNNQIYKLNKNNFLNIVNNITNKRNFNDKKYIHINSIEINNIIKSSNENDEILENKDNTNIYQNLDSTNEEMMNKIKDSIDDNLRVMLNFSYENFLSKESERESKDLIDIYDDEY